MPRLFVIGGCNGAGKTTASYTILPRLLDCSEFINSDEFAKSLSPFDPDKASIMAGRYMHMKMQILMQKKKDFGIESTLATRSLLKIIKESQENGYTVTVLYLWISSPELAIERVKKRVTEGGHDVLDDTVRRRFNAGLINFFNDYMNIADEWILADNSTPPFEVIAEGSKKGFVVHDMQRYNTIRSLVTDTLDPMTPIELVTESIVKEIPKAPIAHDGVPYQE